MNMAFACEPKLTHGRHCLSTSVMIDTTVETPLYQRACAAGRTLTISGSKSSRLSRPARELALGVLSEGQSTNWPGMHASIIPDTSVVSTDSSHAQISNSLHPARTYPLTPPPPLQLSNFLDPPSPQTHPPRPALSLPPGDSSNASPAAPSPTYPCPAREPVPHLAR